MKFEVGGRTNFFGERRHIIRTTHVFESSVFGELLNNGIYVDGLLRRGKLKYRLKNLGIGLLVKTILAQDVEHVDFCALLEHHRAEHHLLKLNVVRGDAPVGVVDVSHELGVPVALGVLVIGRI